MSGEEKVFIPKLIVGLGNPGKKYLNTRHNIGFLVVEKLAERYGASFKEKTRFEGLFAVASGPISTFYLLKPQTFMNVSGRSLQKVTQMYRIEAEELLIVVDDIWQPFGQMRLKESGSSGGHNGLKSIQSLFGAGYPRLRLGVGAPESEGEMANHVLGRFEKNELEAMDSFLSKACDQVGMLLKGISLKEVMVSANLRKTVRDKRAPDQG